jgi:hypothetical protein
VVVVPLLCVLLFSREHRSVRKDVSWLVQVVIVLSFVPVCEMVAASSVIINSLSDCRVPLGLLAGPRRASGLAAAVLLF